MDILFLIGRILFGGYFLVSGINHFTKLSMMAGYTASKGVPYPKLAVQGTGAMMLLGGLGVVLGVYIQVSVALLAIFLIGVTFKMHNFWTVTDPMARMMDMVQFMKNMALLGATLTLLGIPTPWPMSLGW